MDITGYMKNEARLFLDGIVDTVKFGYYSAVKSDWPKTAEMAQRGMRYVFNIPYTCGEVVSFPVSGPLMLYAYIKGNII